MAALAAAPAPPARPCASHTHPCLLRAAWLPSRVAVWAAVLRQGDRGEWREVAGRCFTRPQQEPPARGVRGGAATDGNAQARGRWRAALLGGASKRGRAPRPSTLLSTPNLLCRHTTTRKYITQAQGEPQHTKSSDRRHGGRHHGAGGHPGARARGWVSAASTGGRDVWVGWGKTRGGETCRRRPTATCPPTPARPPDCADFGRRRRGFRAPSPRAPPRKPQPPSRPPPPRQTLSPRRLRPLVAPAPMRLRASATAEVSARHWTAPLLRRSNRLAPAARKVSTPPA